MAADLIHGRVGERMMHGAACAIGLQSLLVLGLVALVVSPLATGVPLAALLCTAAVAALVTYSNYEMYIAQARGDVLRVRLTDIAMAVFPLLVTVAVVVVTPNATVTTLMAAWAIGAEVTACAQLTDAIVTSGLALRWAGRVAWSGPAGDPAAPRPLRVDVTRLRSAAPHSVPALG